MKITGSTGKYTGMYGRASDINEKNLQSQISDAKKELERLDKDVRITDEEKIKKKQELDRKLSDLTSRLRQYRLEKNQQKEEQEETRGPEVSESTGKDTEKNADKNMTGSKRIETLMSVQSGIASSRIHARVMDDLTGRVRIISSEISADRARGADVTYKEEEREKLLKRTDKASRAAIEIEKEKDKKHKEDDGKVILRVAGTSQEERNKYGWISYQ